MRASTAYFIGAGTIVAAIAIGLGGGLVAGNIMHPIAPKVGPDSSKVAQRAEAATPAAVPNSSAPSERLDYLKGSQAFGAVVAAPVQAQPETASAEQPAPPPVAATSSAAEPAKQTETKSTEAKPTETKSAETKSSETKPAKIKSTETRSAETRSAPVRTIETKSADAKPADVKPVDQPAEKQAVTEAPATPDNAFAKARDTDVRRAAAERRRTERHERRAERRRHEVRDPRDRTDWNDVARNIREDSDARDIVASRRGNYAPQDGDRGFPQIRLFGSDDDD